MVAPLVPVLGAVAAASLLGGFWWYSKRDDGELAPLGPPGVPPSLPPAPGPNDPNIPGRNDENPNAPSAVIDGLLGVYEDAAFHETQSGDSINRLVTKTLNAISPGAGNKPAMISGLRKLLNRSKWNRDLYGEPMGSDNYAFEGVAINRVFMPKHEDASAVMKSGFFPKRNTSLQGAREGSSTSWGDPWVPALNHDAVRNGVSDPDIMLAPPWPDGTPATEPPPELYAALRVRGS